MTPRKDGDFEQAMKHEIETKFWIGDFVQFLSPPKTSWGARVLPMRVNQVVVGRGDGIAYWVRTSDERLVIVDECEIEAFVPADFPWSKGVKAEQPPIDE